MTDPYNDDLEIPPYGVVLLPPFSRDMTLFSSLATKLQPTGNEFKVVYSVADIHRKYDAVKDLGSGVCGVYRGANGWVEFGFFRTAPGGYATCLWRGSGDKVIQDTWFGVSGSAEGNVGHLAFGDVRATGQAMLFIADFLDAGPTS